MPRTSSINYFEQRGGYFSQIRGKQHKLALGPDDKPSGPTYLAALERFNELMQGRVATTSAKDSLVSVVLQHHFDSLERANKRNTLHIAKTLLMPAVANFGHIKVGELTPHIVSKWLEAMSDQEKEYSGRNKPWGQTTKHMAVSKLLRAFNWARKQGLIAANPIAEMEKPEKRSRGSEVVIPEPLMAVLIGSTNREFAKVLRFLRGTGCRPGEAVHARASHYRKSISALVYPWQGDDVGWKWKNANKQKRDRVIYLNDEMRELVEGEIAKRPDGYIFQTVRGSDCTLNNLVNLLLKLKRHDAVVAWCLVNDFDPEKVIMYGFRHSYITNMLLKGVPIKVLADWCGTSVRMLEKNYSHIHDDFASMRELFMKFNGAS